MPGSDLVVDLAHADRVGPVHQAAAIAREAEAVQPHHVDITGAQRGALFEDLAGLVDGGEKQPLQDFVITDVAALLDAELGRSFLYDPRDLGIGARGAVAWLVLVPASIGLLPQPAGLDDAVGDRLFAVVGVLLGAAPSRVMADVEPRQIGDRERADRLAEIDHHLVDLLRQCTFLDQKIDLHAERRAAPIGEKTVPIAGEA